MLVEDQIHKCAPCKGHKIKVPSKQKAGLMMGIFLAILPKCPFCIVAYSSTMVLCSGKTVSFGPAHISPLTVTLTAVIGLVALGCILLNFRDNRTIYAFILALTGMVLVLFSMTSGLDSWLYYSGVAIVFSGIWLNASLLNYLGKISAFLSGNRIVN